MIVFALVATWWVCSSFTMGLVSDKKDMDVRRFALIFIAWPIILGEYVKEIVEK